MRRAFRLAALAGLGLAACSVAPPLGVREDPELEHLGGLLLSSGRSVRVPALAVGPVTRSYVDPREAVYGPEQGALAGPLDRKRPEDGASAPREEEDAESQHAWTKPPLEAARLQQRIADLLSWSLCEGKPLPTIDAGSLASIGSSSRPRLCAAADKKRAQLLVQVDVTENRVSWVSRELWWWLDLLLLWGGGVLPVVLVPDEVYEARITARLTIVHARTGVVVVQREYTGAERRTLNSPQRGLSISGLFGLHPFSLSPDEDGYGKAYEALGHHALKALEREIASGLRRSLPEAFERPEVRKLLRDGTEATARTYAIVVGHDGPRVVEPRPPLRFARNDAETVAAWLIESGTAQSRDHLHVLVDEDATPDRICESVKDLAPQLLGLDRLLFYCAGYGRTDAAGRPVLVLGGGKGELPLATLARELEKALITEGQNPRVVFLLDCSFGPQTGRGRTYRSENEQGGPPPPQPITYLDVLGNKAYGWCVIAAAGPAETAYEIVDAQTESARHGFFTACLVDALRGRADVAPRDGVVKTDELIAYLAERVPEAVKAVEGVEQNPERRGAEDPIVLGFARERAQER